MKKKGKVNRERSPEVKAFSIAMREVISATLKSEREKRKMSQSSLADDCKINVRTIRKYENNECPIPSVDLIIIILALNTTLAKVTGNPDI